MNIFYIHLGPASPIVERPSPLPGGGLNISWKSDVTSRQEEYAVRYVRNDTEEVQTIKTRTPRIKLENLYPGAGYEIKVKFIFEVVRDEKENIFLVVSFITPSKNGNHNANIHSNLQVFALSHGLLSNPHISFTAVFPNPPRNLTILKVQNNRLTLKWLPPVNSLYTGYVVR